VECPSGLVSAVGPVPTERAGSASAMALRSTCVPTHCTRGAGRPSRKPQRGGLWISDGRRGPGRIGSAAVVGDGHPRLHVRGIHGLHPVSHGDLRGEPGNGGGSGSRAQQGHVRRRARMGHGRDGRGEAAQRRSRRPAGGARGLPLGARDHSHDSGGLQPRAQPRPALPAELHDAACCLRRVAGDVQADRGLVRARPLREGLGCHLDELAPELGALHPPARSVAHAGELATHLSRGGRFDRRGCRSDLHVSEGRAGGRRSARTRHGLRREAAAPSPG
jgi:hypothetical protein